MSAVAGLLLAAGESRRMGALNKVTASVGGPSLLRNAAQVLCRSRLAEVVVVVGYQAPEALRQLAGLDVRTVLNADYGQGQMSSVHCGLQQFSQPYEGIMICLADQPLVTPADIDLLIDTFLAEERRPILVPTHNGQRGNPIVLSAMHQATILADGTANLGCRRLIERHPQWITTVEMVDDHVLFDVDTPEDCEEWRRRAEPSTYVMEG
ncbi:MAG: nucleotidyltransferase family protein [Acidiferrobacter sp.]